MRDESLTDHLGGHSFGLSSGFYEMDATFKTGFLEMTKASTTSKNLRFNNHTALDAASNILSLFRTEGHVS